MVFFTPDEAAVNTVAKEILAAAEGKKKFAFYGEMGTGKTTLIKAMCRQIGVPPHQMSSPTFSLVNEYNVNGSTIYHFDVYRMKSIEEMYDLGYEEYFYSSAWVFVEWADMVEELIPDDFVKFFLTALPDGGRRVEIAI